MVDEARREPGDVVAGRFEVVDFAGAGGMGSVYRARDRVTGRIVALKLSSDARLAVEAAVLASVEHEAIVEYVDQGRGYLAMAWLTGIDLESWLTRGSVSIAQALVLGTRVASALAAVHARGVVHRDIKPANLILVGDQPEGATLLDFGIARRLGVDAHDAGFVAGTPAFMAPEQIRAEPADARADVYGLGAVVFRALAGRPPFTGAQRLAVTAKVLKEDAAPIGDLRPDVPEALEALIAAMLAKRPEDRPADGAAVLAALQAIPPTSNDGARRRPAVTAGEQRVTCIVLCGDRAREDSTVPITRASADQTRLEAIAHDCGGILEIMQSGSLLVDVIAGTPAERAMRAARCALAISALRPTAPIVVATGHVVQTGSSQVGEVIDRASDAIDAARGKRGGARIDEETAALLDERFVVAPSGRWRALIGERDTVAPVRMFLGRPAPCLGREAELHALRDRLEASIIAPRAQAAVIIGPSGLGKSRLVNELIRTLDPARPIEVLIARNDPVRAGAPFGTVVQLLGASRYENPVFAEISGMPVAEPSPELLAGRADPAVMLDLVRAAWCAHLAARCKRQPVLCVIEDLHWADLPSMRLIDAALSALVRQPLFVIATSRSNEDFPSLWSGRPVLRIELLPLSNAAGAALIHQALGTAIDPQVAASLVERAGGHPFHLEELVRAIADGHRADAIPDTVVGMVQARLDVLDHDARRVLRAGSVFGDCFAPAGVAALLGDAITDEVLATSIDALCAREIVVREASELRFRHDLVRDVAYRTLPEAERALAHRAAATWLESIDPSDVVTLAEHFDRGAAPDRAVSLFRRSAERAASGDDHERAAAFVARARACGPDPVEHARLLAIESEVALWRGDFDASTRQAIAASDGLARGSAEWFDVLAHAITAFGQRGQNDRVAELVERVASIEPREDARGPATTALCRGLTQLYWAHYRGDLAHARTGIVRYVDALGPYHSGWVHRVVAESAWLHRRDVDDCLTSLDESIASFDRAGALRPAGLAHINTASLAAWCGAHDRARIHIARGLAEAERLGSGFLATYGLAVRLLIDAYAGDPDAETGFRALGPKVAASPRLACVSYAMAGWMAFERGAIDVAHGDATIAIALPIVSDLRCSVLALAAACTRDVGQARAAFAASRESTDLELTEGFADLALAVALDAAGDRDGAHAVIAGAYDRMLAIANTIADPAQRAAFLVRPLPNARIAARYEPPSTTPMPNIKLPS